MFQKAKDIAASRGGKCLTEKYTNTDTKMEWECVKGHRWFAKLNHVKDSGSWCPNCSRRKPSLIENARAHAIKKGGECFSEEFETTHAKLQWRCAKGHTWESTYRNTVYLDCWCATCAGHHNNSLELAKSTALARGGICLSARYANSTTLMEWQCAEGHRWRAALNNIKNGGRWCPVCAGHYDHLPNLQKKAAMLGGKCLASRYESAKIKVPWECAMGHRWEASSDSVLNGGRWCPCCPYKSENEIRGIFEEATGLPFQKTRGILPNARLELDGYCEKWRIAFEYQGIQHYEYTPHFHRNGLSDLAAQQQRDRQKEELCDEAWIALVIVPYDLVDARSYIRKELYYLGAIGSP
jgi:hypothetical protein